MKKYPIILITTISLIVIFQSWNKNKTKIYGNIIDIDNVEESYTDPKMNLIKEFEVRSFDSIDVKLVILYTEKDTLDFFVSTELLNNGLVSSQDLVTENKRGFIIVNLKHRKILYVLAPKNTKSQVEVKKLFDMIFGNYEEEERTPQGIKT